MIRELTSFARSDRLFLQTWWSIRIEKPLSWPSRACRSIRLRSGSKIPKNDDLHPLLQMTTEPVDRPLTLAQLGH